MVHTKLEIIGCGYLLIHVTLFSRNVNTNCFKKKTHNFKKMEGLNYIVHLEHLSRFITLVSLDYIDGRNSTRDKYVKWFLFYI